MTASSAIPPVNSYAPGIVTRAPDGSVSRTGTILFLIGAAALATSFAGLFMATTDEVRSEFYFSYLTAFMFTLSLALGALFFVIVQHVARAGWSVVVRRVAVLVRAGANLRIAIVTVGAVLDVPRGCHTRRHPRAGIPKPVPGFGRAGLTGSDGAP